MPFLPRPPGHGPALPRGLPTKPHACPWAPFPGWGRWFFLLFQEREGVGVSPQPTASQFVWSLACGEPCSPDAAVPLIPSSSVPWRPYGPSMATTQMAHRGSHPTGHPSCHRNSQTGPTARQGPLRAPLLPASSLQEPEGGRIAQHFLASDSKNVAPDLLGP